MSQRVLLIGFDGMLGRAWETLLRLGGIAFDAPTLDSLDLTDEQSIEAVVTRKYDVVVNCAAYTDVDGAEANESLASSINAVGAALLARRCRAADATLVHYSTDYVFRGDADSPYSVDHPRDPIGAYGRTKAAGEEAIERSGCQYLIVRTSWLYAPWGNNFVRTIARLASERDTLRVVNDQRGRPTSAEHLARTTLALLSAGARGIYHACDGGECTWFEFAQEIARLIDASCDVHPGDTSEFPRPAPRPAYSVLSLDETEDMVGAMNHWKHNLANVLDRLEVEQAKHT